MTEGENVTENNMRYSNFIYLFSFAQFVKSWQILLELTSLPLFYTDVLCKKPD